MNSNLSSWLSNIKSDDIDDGLAADFDGSLSGLGVEIGASTYNMSEALLALPSVCKQENASIYSASNNAINEGTGSTRSLTLPLLRTISFSSDLITSSPHSLSLPSLSDGQNLAGELETPLDLDSNNPEWVSLMTSMKLGEGEDSSCKPRFQYVLNASTSPATRMSEETLTYLNQGQPYEITLKHLKDSGQAELPLLRSIIRVVFHEKKLQSTEQQQLQTWKSMRPGDRILDIDGPSSRGVVDVKADPVRLNSVEFLWDPNSVESTSAFIKVNCVSSEFTAKKHGGEKGVPFRIRVETYSNNLDEDAMLLNCASCQVKVFKPKGADRKNKMDKEKIEKFTGSEKGKYQPAFNCTVLTESKDALLANQVIPSSVFACVSHPIQVTPVDPSSSSSTATLSHVIISSSSCISAQNSGSDQVAHPPAFQVGPTSAEEASLSSTRSQTKPTALCINQTSHPQTNIGMTSRKRPLETSSSLCSPHSPPNFNEDTLMSSSTPEEVNRWLSSNRFHDFIETFSNFSGSDLLCLRREDLIQICGVANGIRLHNTLLAKSVQPQLTLYLYQATKLIKESMNHDQVFAEVQYSPGSSRSRSSTSSPTPLSQQPPPQMFFPNTVQQSPFHENSPTDGAQVYLNGEGSCETTFIPAATPVKDSAIASNLSFSGFSFPNSKPSTCKSAVAKMRSRASHFSPENQKKFDFKFVPTVTGEKICRRAPERSDVAREFQEETFINFSSSVPTASLQPTCSNKRSISDKDEDSSHQPLLVFKKQRIQIPEGVPRKVFHAVYLETLTERHLASKLAPFFSLRSDAVSQILLRNSIGFFVLIDDKVVQNMRDLSSYVLEAAEDEDLNGFYKILLRPIEV